MNEKKIPQIKVFVYQGRVEAVYGDTSLVDVEIIECASSHYDKQFERQYEKAEDNGLSELYCKTFTCNDPYGGED